MIWVTRFIQIVSKLGALRGLWGWIGSLFGSKTEDPLVQELKDSKTPEQKRSIARRLADRVRRM